MFYVTIPEEDMAVAMRLSVDTLVFSELPRLMGTAQQNAKTRILPVVPDDAEVIGEACESLVMLYWLRVYREEYYASRVSAVDGLVVEDQDDSHFFLWQVRELEEPRRELEYADRALLNAVYMAFPYWKDKDPQVPIFNVQLCQGNVLVVDNSKVLCDKYNLDMHEALPKHTGLFGRTFTLEIDIPKLGLRWPMAPINWPWKGW